MKLFRRQTAYTQEEVAEQIGQIKELVKMRDNTSMESSKEYKSLQNAVETSQEVLAFMLDENVIRFGRKRKSAV